MPDLAIPRNVYFVLVAGLMNPAMHHPQWYRLIGAIDDDELNSSLKSGNNATTSFVSRIDIGSIASVHCQPNLWTIQATDAASWPKMLEVASAVFAKSRNPTINAYGIMAQRHIDTDRDAKDILFRQVKSLNLGFPPGNGANTNVTLAIPDEGFTTTMSVQSSVMGEKTVFGLFHRDYPAHEIESINDGRFAEFAIQSEAFFADMVAAVNSNGKGGDDHER